jgi:hypothetical protein
MDPAAPSAAPPDAPPPPSEPAGPPPAERAPDESYAELELFSTQQLAAACGLPPLGATAARPLLSCSSAPARAPAAPPRAPAPAPAPGAGDLRAAVRAACGGIAALDAAGLSEVMGLAVELLEAARRDMQRRLA